MIQVSKSQLRVEPLKAIHFSLIASGEFSSRIPWMQLMLIRSWIAQAEKSLSALLPARQPNCLLAIEGKNILSIVVIEPCNRRGSCWLITVQELLNNSKNYTTKNIIQRLINEALETQEERAISWIIRCPTYEEDIISAARDIGFQPLKLYRAWYLENSQIDKNSLDSNVKINSQLSWEKITLQNAHLLWQLEKTNDSSHLRKILDRQLQDLLDQNKEYSRVLVNEINNRISVIAALVHRHNSKGETVYELKRDYTWDERINDSLYYLLNHLSQQRKSIIIEIDSEDKQLNKLLSDFGCISQSDEIVLGRSLWKRQTNYKLIKNNKPIENMLGRLQPQRPPLPNPSLHPR